VSGGPVAAIASALRSVEESVVVTLAGDQPWIAPAVPILLQALDGHDVAVLVDGGRHYLAAAWRTRALKAAVADLDSPIDAPVRLLFAGRRVAVVADRDGWSRDIDAPSDLPTSWT
jgi:molybdopterin-guanine dinucleotide biosynthesis protein A